MELVLGHEVSSFCFPPRHSSIMHPYSRRIGRQADLTVSFSAF